jgi:TPR repeat protein
VQTVQAEQKALAVQKAVQAEQTVALAEQEQLQQAVQHLTGGGGDRDPKLGFAMLTPLIHRGNRDAIYWQAKCYYQGFGGVSKNLELAARYFRSAAGRGHIDSQVYLANLYEYGWCDPYVPQDMAEALHWYGAALGSVVRHMVSCRDSQAKAQLIREAIRRCTPPTGEHA